MTTAADRRRRVLLVTVEFRTHPMSGRERRYRQHVAALRQSCEVGVLVLDRNGNATAAPDGLAWWGHSAAPWLDDQIEWMRRPDGHPSYGRLPPDALATLDEAVREFDPDVVIVGGLWMHGHLGRLGERGAHVVLDAADVEGPLHEGLAVASRGGERTVRTALARHVDEIERSAVAFVQQIWVCSEHDASILRARYPQCAQVVVVPNTVDTAPLRRPPALPRPGAPAVVYPASFAYPPNNAAAVSLISEIHPLVRHRFPTATLSLVGTGPSATLQEAAARAPGVRVTGPVSDMRPWLWRSTALAVPLRTGSGTRIKILESFAAGLPVVTTAKGAEGLDVADGEHVVVAQSPREIADAVAALYEDPVASSALAARARHLVETRYSTAAARQAVESALRQVPARTP